RWKRLCGFPPYAAESNLQFEIVTIVVGRETLAECREISRVQSAAENTIALACLEQRVAQIVQYLAVATVGMPLAIFAYAVDTRDEAQVLDGTRRQQAVPGIAPGRRPVGRIEQQIGAIGIAAPHREAQVVADQRAHAPTVQLKYGLLLTGGGRPVLASHAEEMRLVVMQDLTVRARPEQTIAMAAVGRLDNDTAGDHALQTCGLFAQPGIGGPLFRLGQARSTHGKPGGKH